MPVRVISINLWTIKLPKLYSHHQTCACAIAKSNIIKVIDELAYQKLSNISQFIACCVVNRVYLSMHAPI